MRDGLMGRGFDCGDGSSTISTAACCSCTFCSLSSDCLVYGAFVAAVAALV